MDYLVNGHNIFIVIAITFLSSLLLVPIVKIMAKHAGALDMPDKRKVHTVPMPRLGGLAIFASFLIGFIFFIDLSNQTFAILIGGFLVIITGIFDDIKSIKARYKLILQVVAACIFVFYGNTYLNNLTAFGLEIIFPLPLNYIFTIIFIVAIMNAINLIDGIDGLAAGTSSIYYLTIAIIALILNKSNGLDIILAVIMLGATLGFLVHNFPPAKIFMGDTGSLFLGYIIAIIALLGFKAATLTSLIIPILILAIPIFDTLFAVFRRILKGDPIGKPDKEHLHHQLLKKFSAKKTLLVIYLINILFASVSIFYVLGDNQMAIMIYIILMLAILFLILKTDVLFNHDKKRKK